jgi:hypothetical protein
MFFPSEPLWAAQRGNIQKKTSCSYAVVAAGMPERQDSMQGSYKILIRICIRFLVRWSMVEASDVFFKAWTQMVAGWLCITTLCEALYYINLAKPFLPWIVLVFFLTCHRIHLSPSCCVWLYYTNFFHFACPGQFELPGEYRQRLGL